MSCEEDLKAALIVHAGLAALVGGRVFPVALKQGTDFPALTYRRTGGERIGSHDGYSGLTLARFEVGSWAETYSEAKAVAQQARQALALLPQTTVQGDEDDPETPGLGLFHVITPVVIPTREA